MLTFANSQASRLISRRINNWHVLLLQSCTLLDDTTHRHSGVQPRLSPKLTCLISVVHLQMAFCNFSKHAVRASKLSNFSWSGTRVHDGKRSTSTAKKSCSSLESVHLTLSSNSGKYISTLLASPRFRGRGTFMGGSRRQALRTSWRTRWKFLRYCRSNSWYVCLLEMMRPRYSCNETDDDPGVNIEDAT